VNFDLLLDEMDMLCGKELKPLGRAAPIELLEIDRDENQVRLSVWGRGETTRSLDELRGLWRELKRLPAVHVDTVLAGSGSSRNQPETLLANLPFIEYLVVDKRKHISLVNGRTHPAGTIRKMDDVAIEICKQALRDAKPQRLRVVVVVEAVGPAAQDLALTFGCETEPQGDGYRLSLRDFDLDVVPTTAQLPTGTYLVLSDVRTEGVAVDFGGMPLNLVLVHGMSALTRRP
jgi:hypothetical protein